MESHQTIGALSAEYQYTNDQLLLFYENNTAYLATKDHLGSTRVLTNTAGAVTECDDYLPFGELLSYSGAHPCLNTSTTSHKFTGKERDTETNLDNFGARYFSSVQGRFMIPDWDAKPTTVPYAEFGNPQSLNLYSYVGNNPLSRTDTNGHVQTDQAGNVLFTQTGSGVVTFMQDQQINDKGHTMSISWNANFGTITADDGSKIQASKATSDMNVTIKDKDGNVVSQRGSDLLPAGFSNSSDCHGTTFARGQVWIDNDQAASLLKGDVYTPTSSPKNGDVGLYSSDGILGMQFTAYGLTASTPSDSHHAS